MNTDLSSFNTVKQLEDVYNWRQLQALLRERGLSQHGDKRELATRLMDSLRKERARVGFWQYYRDLIYDVKAQVSPQVVVQPPQVRGPNYSRMSVEDLLAEASRRSLEVPRDKNNYRALCALLAENDKNVGAANVTRGRPRKYATNAAYFVENRQRAKRR